MNEYVALLCAPDGSLLEVLRTCAGGPALAPGEPIAGLVAAGSRGDLSALVDRLRVEGHAIGWRLLIPLDGRDTVFLAAGARVHENFLLLACPASALVDGAEEPAAGARGDVEIYDEMSRLNNELATMQRELVRRNAGLEALIREKNEILGMAAHDLRNPLAAIRGLAEHLISEVRSVLGERHVEMLEHLRSSSDHMLRLVDDLLDFSALQAGTLSLSLSATDLPDLVARVVRLARELARDKGIWIDLEAMEAPAVARAVALDPHKINQALSNLLSNAVKFSHPGATITVTVTYVGGEVAIAVVDRGVGIDPEHLKRLFRPFQTGRPGTRGERSTGLGLTIVRRILQGHGGDVEVASRRGEGSTFTIRLPLRPAVVAAPPAIAVDRLAPIGEAITVLLADDDPATRVVVRAFLEALGCQVSEAEDADAALAALRGGRFDLALVDLEMPGGGGRAVLAGLRAEGRVPTRIAALTGHALAAVALPDCLAFDGYLTKPARIEDLAGLVARLVPRPGAGSDAGR